MAKQKKPVHRVQITEGKRNMIHQLLEEYDIQDTLCYSGLLVYKSSSCVLDIDILDIDCSC